MSWRRLDNVLSMHPPRQQVRLTLRFKRSKGDVNVRLSADCAFKPAFDDIYSRVVSWSLLVRNNSWSQSVWT
jgi:hypothetical protein